MMLKVWQVQQTTFISCGTRIPENSIMILGLQLHLQAQAIRDIKAGEPLYTAYGDLFWDEKKPIGRAAIEEIALEDIEGSEDVEQDNEDEPLGPKTTLLLSDRETPTSTPKRSTRIPALYRRQLSTHPFMLVIQMTPLTTQNLKRIDASPKPPPNDDRSLLPTTMMNCM